MAVASEPFVELSFAGPPQPRDPTPFTVCFMQDGEQFAVPGFWDGGTSYRVRFAPERGGRWSWRSTSDEPLLHGLTGEVLLAEPTGPGSVRVAARFHFAHQDGTPFRPVGTTVYNWLHQAEPLFTATLDAIAAAGFNKLRFLVLPQAGNHVGHVPALLPFERDEAGDWDVTRPVVAFFQRLDAAVAALYDRGIQADLLVFNAYDNGHFGLDRLTAAQDTVYLRYLVARLSAYPNLWWSLCNEYDLLERPDERWDEVGELLAGLDPHQRLRSIHNWMDLYDHNRPWVTHASIQNGSATTEFGRASLYRDVYRKPVVLDEIKYEGDIPERWGRLDARQLVHQFWIATVSGCYASHGESFLLPDGSLHVVAGGPLRGESPARLGFLRRFLDDLAVPGLDPIDGWDDPGYVAGVPRQQYVQYLGREAPDSWTFRLPQGNKGERLQVGDAFEVVIVDTWAMTTAPVGRRFTLTEVCRNDAHAHDDDPIELSAGRALALCITRIEETKD